ncbi:anaerobic sulfatase-maturating enzyme [Lachnospiraceae bacterium]|nr:anaerobic sulfatase-maturating enzyme [Lachnospiraceae bacterium]
MKEIQNEKTYTIGHIKPEWGDGVAQTITFIVTEDCNLRCKYCYVTHKSKGKVMSLEIAQKFIDYLLTSNEIYRSDSVILDFIGGEPLLEAKLIGQICDYFKVRAFEENLDWYWKYRINISTNGVNYTDKDVQQLIEKNRGKISIGITIDGTKEKHDLQRVFPDGSGSYNIVYENVKLWLTQFEGSTKVTFASEDLKYLKNSIIHLWNIGITDVAASVVYENVWKENDDIIFEEQLKELADYIVDNDLYNKYQCTLFAEHVGLPFIEEDLNKTSCGAGKMLALSPKGDIYPCIRYYDHSLNHRKGYIIGNVNKGIDFEKARIFLLAMYRYQCDDECLECPVARGCEFCQGFNYDEADSATNFQKVKYICKMHKARVKANNYYFAKLYHKKGIRRKGYYWKNNLLFLLNDSYVSFCSYRPRSKESKYMDKKTIMRGLEYAKNNFMRPVFVHSTQIDMKELVEYDEYEVLHRIPIEAYRENMPLDDYQIIVNCKTIDFLDEIPNQNNLFFNVEQSELGRLSEFIERMLAKSDRVNVNVQGLTELFDHNGYYLQLKRCADIIKKIYDETRILKEINVITDLLFVSSHEGCDAGENSYVFAPDGNFYICPAFYSEGMENIGNPSIGIRVKNHQLYTKKYMPLCQMCDTYQCENCKYINRLYTNEVNVSPSFQCMKAQIERKVSLQLQEMLRDRYNFAHLLEEKRCEDPINYLRKDTESIGYYKFQ